MKRGMKNLTYRNLMVVIHKIQAKGYTFEEAEPVARNIFAEYRPEGLSIEERVRRVLTDKGRVGERERPGVWLMTMLPDFFVYMNPGLWYTDFRRGGVLVCLVTENSLKVNRNSLTKGLKSVNIKVSLKKA